MSSVHRFSWMILNAGRRFALPSRRRSSMEHINCLSPTAAGSSLPVERRGQVSHGAISSAVGGEMHVADIAAAAADGLSVAKRQAAGRMVRTMRGAMAPRPDRRGRVFPAAYADAGCGKRGCLHALPVEEDVLAMLVTAQAGANVIANAT